MYFDSKLTSALAIGGALFVLSLFLRKNSFSSSSDSTMLGGKKDVDLKDSNSLEIDEIANFAVSEHNNRQNSLEKLNFSKVVSVQKQVVAGILYHLVIEVEEKSQPKQYEAKVWVKPGAAGKKLEEFKPKDGGLTSADLGAKTGASHSKGPLKGPGPKQSVPTNDPGVKEAAEEILRVLNLGSNSLVPFELNEIVSAEAELEDESARFFLLLKTKRGARDNVYKSEVSRNGEGEWSVAHTTAQP